MENLRKKLKPVVKYVENLTGYLIFLKERDKGRLLTGTAEIDGITHKLAYVYFNDISQALHEMGHLLSTPGLRPFSKIGLLLRELEAWRTAECLADKFQLEFNEESFDEGFGSYIIDLIASEERPSFEWLSQLIGE